MAKTLLTQHFNCFAAQPVASFGEWRNVFGAKQKFWNLSETSWTPGNYENVLKLEPTHYILRIPSEDALCVQCTNEYMDIAGDMGDQICSVSPPRRGEFRANLAAKTLGHQTWIVSGMPRTHWLRNPVSLLCATPAFSPQISANHASLLCLRWPHIIHQVH